MSEETALYHIYDEADLLLYIGISKDFGTRWKRHARSQPWWGERRRMTVLLYDSRPEAEAAETAAIRAERPKYNKAHTGTYETRPALPSRIVPTAPLAPCASSAVPLAEVRKLPAAMGLAEAGRLLGIPRNRAFGLMRSGRFPCTVHNYGGSIRVHLVDVLGTLGLGWDGKPLAVPAAQGGTA